MEGVSGKNRLVWAMGLLAIFVEVRLLYPKRVSYVEMSWLAIPVVADNRGNIFTHGGTTHRNAPLLGFYKNKKPVIWKITSPSCLKAKKANRVLGR